MDRSAAENKASDVQMLDSAKPSENKQIDVDDDLYWPSDDEIETPSTDFYGNDFDLASVPLTLPGSGFVPDGFVLPWSADSLLKSLVNDLVLLLLFTVNTFLNNTKTFRNKQMWICIEILVQNENESERRFLITRLLLNTTNLHQNAEN